MNRVWRAIATLALLAIVSPAALAAELDGKQLGVVWALPFIGTLLSIALLPLLTPRVWHHHYGKIIAAWALAFIVPFAAIFGAGLAGASFMHALVGEYLPFIILLSALFTVVGGIHIRGNLHGSPGLNTGLLAIGAVLASFMGTTGASVLMIRPLIRA
ncbi:MAG: sodium:proton antiporter, partial [Burkholderiaceae bacterium]